MSSITTIIQNYIFFLLKEINYTKLDKLNF